MNKAEFQKAFEIAVSDQDPSAVEDDILHGCALPDFDPVTCTVECVAKMIRWQCIQLDGSVDENELDSLRNLFRRKVTVVSAQPI